MKEISIKDKTVTESKQKRNTKDFIFYQLELQISYQNFKQLIKTKKRNNS
jgi:hypothetical protein